MAVSNSAGCTASALRSTAELVLSGIEVVIVVLSSDECKIPLSSFGGLKGQSVTPRTNPMSPSQTIKGRGNLKYASDVRGVRTALSLSPNLLIRLLPIDYSRHWHGSSSC